MYYKSLKINEIEYLLAVNLSGEGAPTSSLEAEVGMFYMDKTNGDLYKFTPGGWMLFAIVLPGAGKAFKAFNIVDKGDGTAVATVWSDTFTTITGYNPSGAASVTYSDKTIDALKELGYTKANVQAALTALQTLLDSGETVYFSRHWLSTQTKVSTIVSTDSENCTLTFDMSGVSEILLNYREDRLAEGHIYNTVSFVGYPQIGVIDIAFKAVQSGFETEASAAFAFTTGAGTKAAGKYGAAINAYTKAGYAALASGYNTEALGNCSFTSGMNTVARAPFGSAQGDGVQSLSECQSARGRFNVLDDERKYIDIVGNGTSDTDRSNAYALTYDGVGWFAKDLKIGNIDYSIKEVVEGFKQQVTDGSGGLKYTMNTDQSTYILAGRGASTATDVVVGSHLFGTPVATVDTLAFNGDSVITSLKFLGTDIVIKNSSDNSQGAFRACAYLKSIDFTGVSDIGDHSCRNNWSLTDINLNGVKRIGKHAFHSCGNLSPFDIPEGVETIDEAAFLGAKIEGELILPSTLKNVGMAAFSGVKVSIITFTSKPNQIAKRTFENCSNLTDIYVPWAVGEVSGAPWDAPNAKIHYTYVPSTDGLVYELSSDGTYYTVTGVDSLLGNGDIVIAAEIDGIPVTSIGDYAFTDELNPRSVTIPNSVTSIGNYAFAACENLTSVTIPSRTTSVGDYAFGGCISLTSVELMGAPTISSDAFASCPNLTTITCRYLKGYYSGAPWGATNATMKYGIWAPG